MCKRFGSSGVLVQAGRGMIITKHAQQRWNERFDHRVENRLMQEFDIAKKAKHNYVRSLSVKAVQGHNYYVTPLCVFVVHIKSHSIVTVLPRRD